MDSLISALYPNIGHATMPMPNPATGELLVDPEIHLIAKKFNLDISFYYSTGHEVDGEYGRQRACSINAKVVSMANGAYVVRGDFSTYTYSLVGSDSGITTYTGAGPNSQIRNTLVHDGSKFVETSPEGFQLEYATQSGTTFYVSARKDAQGVTQTITYGTGDEANLIKAIQLPGGRLVTFNYVPTIGGGPVSLLSYVEDWTGRRTSLQYDSNPVSYTHLTLPTNREV